MLHRVLHSLLQLALDGLQATDILPADIGDLHDGLTQSTARVQAQAGLQVARHTLPWGGENGGWRTGAMSCARSAPGVGDAKRGLEMIVGDSHGIQNLGINVVLLKVNQVHLLTDALQRSLGTQGSQICTNIAGCPSAQDMMSVTNNGKGSSKI